MSEGRKKNRKSKLEVREDCDYEQQAEPDLQRYLKLLKADHDYISSDYVPEPIQLSIKVEVEEFEPDSIPFDLPTETPTTSSAFDDAKIKSCHQQISTLKRYGNRGLCKKIVFSIEKILQTAEHTVSIAPTVPNKILNICLRNLVGAYIREDVIEDPYDTLIRNALLKWPSWCKVTNIKDPPLFYQCYICNLSWWHYYPFREHVKEHNVKALKILFEYEKTVCYLVATDSTEVTITYMPTEGECYRCGNDFEFHFKNKDNYKCPYCLKIFTSCSIYKWHEGRCLSREKDDQKFCIICHSYISTKDIKKHFILTHVVRSDMPVPLINRYCSLCKQVYHSFAYHICSKSGMNSQCDMCKRKFATRKLAQLHNETNLSNIACSLCNIVLVKKCSQMEHMLVHTELFKLVYKCVHCNDIFVDEDSIRLHRIHQHRQKSDKRRCMQFGIPVPERCTREDAIEIIDYNSKPKSNSDINIDVSTLEKKPKPKKLKKINIDSIAHYPDDEDGQDWSIGQSSSHGRTSSNNCGKISSNTHKIVEKSNSHNNYGAGSSTVEYDDDKLDKSYIEFLSNSKEMDKNLVYGNDENSSSTKNDEQTPNIEVTVETEPMEYKEGVSNVFQVSPEIANNSNVFKVSKHLEIYDNYVKIKTEPVDDFEITEQNSQNDISQTEYFPIGVTVKEEVFNQFEKENLMIKTEPNDENDEYYANDETSQDYCIDIKNEPLTDVKSSSFTSDVNPSDCLDSIEEYCTPEVEYGESNDETDPLWAFAFNENPYYCSKCNKSFKSCRDYIVHLRMMHALPAGICPCCGEREGKMFKLTQHLEKHVRNIYVRMKCLSKHYKTYKCIYTCRVCHKPVPKKKDFFRHWEKHAYDNKLKFEHQTLKQEVEPSFAADRKLKPEMLANTLKQLTSTTDCRACCVCQRQFTRRADTKRHLIEHLLADAHVQREVTMTLRCQQCCEDFLKPEHYKFHMRDHGGLTIYRCDICQKNFSDSSNFAKHSKVHNVRVLICDLCKKKFNAKQSLERHMIMVHQNATNEYVCNICNTPCYSTLERKRHKQKYHKGPAYRCHICNSVFNSLKLKWDHEWFAHKQRKYQADCPICFKSFRKISDVRRHARHAHQKSLTFRRCREPVTIDF